MLKLRVKQVTFESYNDSTKRPKPKENQLGIYGIQLGNLLILLEIQQRVSGSGESAAGVTYPSIRIHPKSFCIFLLKATATLLSSHIVKVGVDATC